jgi:hypothetical protein
MPAPTRPACRWCGKPLRRYRYRDREWAKGKEWGDYGDGFFCGLRCAYGWAVKTCQLLAQKSKARAT